MGVNEKWPCVRQMALIADCCYPSPQSRLPRKSATAKPHIGASATHCRGATAYATTATCSATASSTQRRRLLLDYCS
jgi:hypothetical protein